MRLRGRVGWVGLLCALTFACAPAQPLRTPDETIALLATGTPLLNCREACLDAWRRTQPEAASLLSRGRWRELAILVAGVNFEDDLSIYYLGRAAQALGFRDAAISYYRQSMTLSGTSIGCANLSRLCGGVILPRAASMRLSALEHPPRRAPRSRAPQPPADFEPPSPEPVIPASPAPLPKAPADAGDYIEPPAAR